MITFLSRGKKHPFSPVTNDLCAVAGELTPDDLPEIGSAAAKITIYGARYPEALEERTGL